LFQAIRDGIKAGGLFVGVFPMTGINPAYQMHPGEARDIFRDWTLLHCVEGDRAEIVAEKP
jgi:hypothetical protein